MKMKLFLALNVNHCLTMKKNAHFGTKRVIIFYFCAVLNLMLEETQTKHDTRKFYPFI